jgi:hypothetical protein
MSTVRDLKWDINMENIEPLSAIPTTVHPHLRKLLMTGNVVGRKETNVGSKELERPCDHPKPWLLIDWGSIPRVFKCRSCGFVWKELDMK